MPVPVVTDASDDPDRDAVHRSGCLHFEANDIVLVSKLISLPSILHQLVPGADRTIPHSRAFFRRPYCSPHDPLTPIVALVIEDVLILAWILKCALAVLLISEGFLVGNDDVRIIWCFELNTANCRPDDGLCLSQSFSKAEEFKSTISCLFSQFVCDEPCAILGR